MSHLPKGEGLFGDAPPKQAALFDSLLEAEANEEGGDFGDPLNVVNINDQLVEKDEQYVEYDEDDDEEYYLDQEEEEEQQFHHQQQQQQQQQHYHKEVAAGEVEYEEECEMCIEYIQRIEELVEKCQGYEEQENSWREQWLRRETSVKEERAGFEDEINALREQLKTSQTSSPHQDSWQSSTDVQSPGIDPDEFEHEREMWEDERENFHQKIEALKSELISQKRQNKEIVEKTEDENIQWKTDKEKLQRIAQQMQKKLKTIIAEKEQIEAENSQLESRAKTLEERCRVVEHEFSQEQERWKSERGRIIKQEQESREKQIDKEIQELIQDSVVEEVLFKQESAEKSFSEELFASAKMEPQSDDSILPLETEEVTAQSGECPHCGEPEQQLMNFCFRCGSEIEQQKQEETQSPFQRQRPRPIRAKTTPTAGGSTRPRSKNVRIQQQRPPSASSPSQSLRDAAVTPTSVLETKPSTTNSSTSYTLPSQKTSEDTQTSQGGRPTRRKTTSYKPKRKKKATSHRGTTKICNECGELHPASRECPKCSRLNRVSAPTAEQEHHQKSSSPPQVTRAKSTPAHVQTAKAARAEPQTREISQSEIERDLPELQTTLPNLEKIENSDIPPIELSLDCPHCEEPVQFRTYCRVCGKGTRYLERKKEAKLEAARLGTTVKKMTKRPRHGASYGKPPRKPNQQNEEPTPQEENQTQSEPQEKPAPTRSAVRTVPTKPKSGVAAKFKQIKTPKCSKCGKTAYANESISFSGGNWHKRCFKCQTCKRGLTMGSFREHNYLPYCEKCVRAVEG